METGPDTQANSSYLPFWFLPNEMDPGYPGRVYLYENQPSKTSILNYCRPFKFILYEHAKNGRELRGSEV